MQTRVGYAGGSTERPVYRNLGNHAEVVRVVFDPASTSYADLLAQCFAWHEPPRSLGQHRSLLVPTDGAQQAEAERILALRVGQTSPEIVAPHTPESRFWDAEDDHQKYRLRRDGALASLLEAELGADWDQHAIATQLNAGGKPGAGLSSWLEQLSPSRKRAFDLA